LTTISQNDGEILDNNISSISDFFQLMKPRVMSLVIFTALIGYFCGVFSTETILNPYLSMIGILAIALGAGSSGENVKERKKNRNKKKGKREK
jgi:protoheme IX farnesyltransferase